MIATLHAVQAGRAPAAVNHAEAHPNPRREVIERGAPKQRDGVLGKLVFAQELVVVGERRYADGALQRPPTNSVGKAHLADDVPAITARVEDPLIVVAPDKVPVSLMTALLCSSAVVPSFAVNESSVLATATET